MEILNNATLQTQSVAGDFVSGGQIQTSPIAYDGTLLFVMIARVVNAPGGTSPTLTFAIQQSNDGINWSQVGPNLAALTAAGVQLTPYATGQTQGPINQVWWRVVAVPGGTNAVWTGVYVDVVSQLT